MGKKFYITTAIDYPNSFPHLGHAYEKTCADIIARWHRLLGEEVFFLTGTDEHGQKIQKAAEKAGMKPKEFVDAQVKHFIALCREWNISNDRFIRTTDSAHEKFCKEFFQKVFDKGDIYLGKYEGLYCVKCETFYTEKDAPSGMCPIHKSALEKLKEESYFFKMGNYQKKWLEFIKKNPEFISPKSKKQEIINRVEEKLLDLSVSRTSFSWGIKTPVNENHVIYVWFDALLNYISGVNSNKKQFKKFWPADVHLIGKDILWHHSVIWPTMLMSAGFPLPKKVFVHGFINTESGEKMSKSLGTVIDPMELSREFPVDALRYYLIREIPFGEDGFFSKEKLIERINSELANSLGNLVSRELAMLEKFNSGLVPAGKIDESLAKKLDLNSIEKKMLALDLTHALEEIMGFVNEINKYVNEKEPWKLEGIERDKALYSIAESIVASAILLSPFMPSSSEKILEKFGLKKLDSIKQVDFRQLKAGTKTIKGANLFEKIAEK